jgi:phage-related protein
MVDGAVVIDTKIDSQQVKPGLSKLTNILKGGLGIAVKTVTAGVAGLAAGFAVLGAKVADFTAATDRIDKASKRIGVSAKGFQELEFALSQSGVRVETLQSSMRQLRGAIDNNSDGFKKLGISITDANGEKKTQEQILKESITAFQSIESSVEKARLAENLFGKSATELMPLLDGQAGSFDELVQKANELGIVLDDKAVNAGVQLTDALDSMKRSFQSLTRNAIAPIIPQISKLAVTITDFVTKAGNVKNIQEAMKRVIAIVITVVEIIKEMGKTVFDVMKNIFDNVKNASNSFLTQRNAIMFLAGGIAFVESAFRILGRILEGIIRSFNNLLTVIINTAQSLYNLLTGDFKAAFQNAKNIVVAVIDDIENIAKTFAETGKIIIEEVTTFTEKTMEKAEEIEDRFVGTLARINNDWENMGKTGEQVLNSLSGSMNQMSEEEIALIDFIKEYEKQLDIINRKIKDNIITEEEGREATLKLVEKNIDALYEMGYSLDEVGSMGSEVITILKQKLKTLIPASQEIGTQIGEEITENTKRSLLETLSKVISTIKKVVTNMIKAVQSTIKVFQNVFKFISSLAKIDTKALFKSFEEIIAGLENFFLKEIGSMSIFFEMGSEIINNFLWGIIKNEKNIIKSFDNMIKTLIKTITDNSGTWTRIIISFVFSFLEVILKNAPLIVSTFLKMIIDIINNLHDNLPRMFPIIIEAITGVIKAVNQYLPELIDLFFDGVEIIIDLFISLFPELIKATLDNFPNIIKAFLNGIVKIVTAITGNIGLFIEAIIEIVLAIIQALTDPGVITSLIRAGLQIAIAIIKGLTDGKVITSIMNATMNIIDTILDILFDPSFISQIIEIAMTIIMNLALALIDPRNLIEITRAVIQIIAKIIEYFANPQNWIKLGNAIVEGTRNAWDGMVKSGADAWNGFQKGIQDQWEKNKKDWNNFWGKVESDWKSFWGIKSPSRKMAEMGTQLIAGLGVGINQTGKNLYKDVSKTFDNFNNEMNDNINAGGVVDITANAQAVESVLTGLRKGVNMDISTDKMHNINITIHNYLNCKLQLDGRELTRIVFQNIDKVTRASYGF